MVLKHYEAWGRLPVAVPKFGDVSGTETARGRPQDVPKNLGTAGHEAGTDRSGDGWGTPK